LLRTALAEPGNGDEAWRELGADFDLRTLESGTVSVLPLVYRRLSQRLPGDPRLPHLKGVLRSTWVRNNLLVEQLAMALDAFQGAGVETLLIGSLAAAVRYYPELGVRPTPALDFLVAPDALALGWRTLGRLGWSASSATPPPGGQPILLRNARGEMCLLRTTAGVELSLDYAALRPAAATVQVGRCTALAPSAEHDLLAAVATGARSKPVRSIQWLVDAAQISQSLTGSRDWESMLALARDQGQSYRLHQTFAYLAGVLAVSLPPAAARVRDAPAVPVRERVAYRLAGASVGGAGSLPHALAEHLVDTRATPGMQALITLPRFLRLRWQVEHGWQLPLAGGRRAVGVLVRRAGRKP
jgi:hypothetical protein